YSPLFTLRSKPHKLAPLFCIPGAGANITSFLDLIAQLAEDLPIYGFQPRGLDGMLVPHSTVSAAAKANLRAIYELDLDQPIHLVGHSFGGWIAFEMANLLVGAGKRVSSLTIVDSEAPSIGTVKAEYSNIDAIMQWIEV